MIYEKSSTVHCGKNVVPNIIVTTNETDTNYVWNLRGTKELYEESEFDSLEIVVGIWREKE